MSNRATVVDAEPGVSRDGDSARTVVQPLSVERLRGGRSTSDPMDMSGQNTLRKELKLLAQWRRRGRLFVILSNVRRSSFGYGSCCALGRPLKSTSPPLHGLHSLGMVHAPSFRPRPRPNCQWRLRSATSPIMP